MVQEGRDSSYGYSGAAWTLIADTWIALEIWGLKCLRTLSSPPNLLGMNRTAFRKPRSDKGKTHRVSNPEFKALQNHLAAKGKRMPLTLSQFHEFLNQPCSLCEGESTHVFPYKVGFMAYCPRCAQFIKDGYTEEELIALSKAIYSYRA